ncbi:MAG TPA: acetaldehyde dehydrogenase (acetylating) [Solirubrobacteraceae bacterium]|jgi:acetaldehyde dehydrogenase|nr:acetaldehyde dehydrogenase (acetylating) [Solirubrobacteraceae bacterium]
MSEPVAVGILGTGNIGTDLLMKLRAVPEVRVAMFAGIEPASEGIARAAALGVLTSAEGIEAILAEEEIRIVFDATSAYAHREAAPRLREAGKIAIDLTPAALGPLVVPAVNLHEHAGAPNVNLITCGGQAIVPIVDAINRVAPLRYAEMVSTIASLSAGPGTRRNIDEFTRTTARAMEVVGGAQQGKAIIVLNPADPPILMRNTLYAVPSGATLDEQAVADAVQRRVDEVAAYVPGYRLKSPVVIDEQQTRWGRVPVAVVLLEVQGAGDFLPEYAGNLDIMTAAACRVGRSMAASLREGAFT